MIQVPNSKRKRALALIDVQDAFINASTRSALLNIKRLLEAVSYHAYVEAVFSAGSRSLWQRQTGWALPARGGVHTVSEVSDLLPRRGIRRIQKHSKSIFSGDPRLVTHLRSKGIEELHLVGFDLNDCVLASAFDSFDAGFFTF